VRDGRRQLEVAEKERVTWRRLIDSPILHEERREDHEFARERGEILHIWKTKYLE